MTREQVLTCMAVATGRQQDLEAVEMELQCTTCEDHSIEGQLGVAAVKAKSTRGCAAYCDFCHGGECCRDNEACYTLDILNSQEKKGRSITGACMALVREAKMLTCLSERKTWAKRYCCNTPHTLALVPKLGPCSNEPAAMPLPV